MKKKILALALCVAMVAIAVIGGSLAYFTDTDKDINVMTSGDVHIIQNETDRDGNAYKDKQDLYPAVYLEKDENGKWVPYNGNNPAYDSTMASTDSNGGTLNIWDESINNEIDKVISVTNTGSRDAYIRTIVLMENTADNAICEKIHGLWCDSDGQYRVWATNTDGSELQVEIYGTTYSVAVCTYETALAAGATSAPSLVQIFLDPTATNEWSELLQNNEFSIIAISQAVQTVGFEGYSSEVALNTAFGEVTAENVLNWFENSDIDTTGAYNVVGGFIPEN